MLGQTLFAARIHPKTFCNKLAPEEADALYSQAQSLYDLDLAPYSPDDAFDHTAAKGFIKLWGLPTKVYAKVQAKVAGATEQAEAETVK